MAYGSFTRCTFLRTMFETTMAMRRQLLVIWSGHASGRLIFAQSVPAVCNVILVVFFLITAFMLILAPVRLLFYVLAGLATSKRLSNPDTFTWPLVCVSFDYRHALQGSWSNGNIHFQTQGYFARPAIILRLICRFFGGRCRRWQSLGQY